MILVIVILLLAVGVTGGSVLAVREFDSLLVGWTLFLVGALGVAIYGASSYACVYHNDHWAVCTILSKDRGASNGGYRIYTKQCGVLEDKDSKLRLKFNSADIWSQIVPGQTLRLHIAGSRFGPFSTFPNIFGVESADS